MTLRTTTPILVFACGLLCAGCGGDGYGERYAISGEVTLDGQPLDEGRILLTPLDATANAPGATGTIAAGRYVIPAEAGPGLGKYRVMIHRDRKTGRQVPNYDGAEGDMQEEIVESIPAAYNTRSTLEADVAGDGDVFKFDLLSKPARR
jgi:hypothetical protein